MESLGALLALWLVVVVPLLWFFLALFVSTAGSGLGRSSIAWFFVGLAFGPLALVMVLVVAAVDLRSDFSRSGSTVRAPSSPAPSRRPEVYEIDEPPRGRR